MLIFLNVSHKYGLEKSLAILRKLRGESTKLKAILLAMRVVSFRQVASLSVHVSDLTILKKNTVKTLENVVGLEEKAVVLSYQG